MATKATRRRTRNRRLLGEKIRVDTKALSKLPLAERTLLIGLWHATNELNALRKLILLSSNNRTRGRLESDAKALVSVLLVKTFAVKSMEAWEFFKEAQNFPDFKEKYLQHQISAELIEAKNKLGSYFGKKNLLYEVRTKLGAHYDYQTISKAVSDISRIDSYIFLPESSGNSLYWVAEEFQARALQKLGHPDESLRSVFKRLIDEVDKVANQITALAQLISVVAVDASGNRRSVELSLTNKVRSRLYEAADIPFFIDVSSLLKK